MNAAEAFWRVHEGLPQQGPGSDASTLRALAAMRGLAEDARIVDIGCGPGRQTVALARATHGKVVAVDLLPPFLAQLEVRAEAAGVRDRIEIVKASMDALTFPLGSFDVVWSEGAIYIMGFEAGLRAWRPLLAPGGFAAVTEASWLCGETDRPEEVTKFWTEGYPDMADVATNRARAERAGYRVVEHFALGEDEWWAYYEPMERRLDELRARYAGEPESLDTLAHCELEIDIFRVRADSYSYVFYVLQRDDEAGG